MVVAFAALKKAGAALGRIHCIVNPNTCMRDQTRSDSLLGEVRDIGAVS